jgi:chemotaxis protein MotC
MTVPWRAWASAAFALVAPAAASAASANFADMADELQRIQLQIAQGDKAAYAAQLNQLKIMGAAIAAAEPETWKDRRQADSLVIYILSGGSLADLAPLLKGDAVVESEWALARGALAYVTNHEAEAISLLGKEDLNALDARLSGEVAFARSVLETKRDAKAAVELLDWARLVAPGGLVEEAALRREIALLAEAKDVGRAAMLTRQYATRFAASLYAADFFRDLAAAIVRFGLADDPGDYQLMARARAVRRPCALASISRPAECFRTPMTRPPPICGRSRPRSWTRPTPICSRRSGGSPRSCGSLPKPAPSVPRALPSTRATRTKRAGRR